MMISKLQRMSPLVSTVIITLALLTLFFIPTLANLFLIGFASEDSASGIRAALWFGADKECRESGETPLICAVRSGSRSAVLELLRARADPNAPASGDEGTTPLMYAASEDRFEICQDLMRAGADAKVQTITGDSALLEASVWKD